MKYSVLVSVDLSGCIEVEADSIEEAEEKAIEEFEIANLDIDNIETTVE